MSARERSDPSHFQVAVAVAYIFAFLFAIAFAFQPYEPAYRGRYLAIAVTIASCLCLSKYRLAMMGSGLAMVAFRSLIGFAVFPPHSAVFLLLAISSAVLAWWLLKAGANRER